MKSEAEIKEAHDMLDKAARFSLKMKDRESYEMTANLAMALSWVLDGDHTDAMDELLGGAKWAADGGPSVN